MGYSETGLWLWHTFLYYSVEGWSRAFMFLDLFLQFWGPYVELTLVSLLMNMVLIYKLWKAEEIKDPQQRGKLKAIYISIFAVIYSAYIMWRLAMTAFLDYIPTGAVSSAAGERAKEFPMDAWVLIMVFALLVGSILPFRFAHLTTLSHIIHICTIVFAFVADFVVYSWNPGDHPWPMAIIVIVFALWSGLRKEYGKRKIGRKKEA